MIVDDVMRFHETVRYGMFVVMCVVGSAMMTSIPFAIAGRGNRLLWLLISPCIALAWFGLTSGLGQAGLHLVLLPTLPVILCVSAWILQRLRERQ